MQPHHHLPPSCLQAHLVPTQTYPCTLAFRPWGRRNTQGILEKYLLKISNNLQAISLTNHSSSSKGCHTKSWKSFIFSHYLLGFVTVEVVSKRPTLSTVPGDSDTKFAAPDAVRQEAEHWIAWEGCQEKCPTISDSLTIAPNRQLSQNCLFWCRNFNYRQLNKPKETGLTMDAKFLWKHPSVSCSWSLSKYINALHLTS